MIDTNRRLETIPLEQGTRLASRTSHRFRHVPPVDHTVERRIGRGKRKDANPTAGTEARIEVRLLTGECDQEQWVDLGAERCIAESRITQDRGDRLRLSRDDRVVAVGDRDVTGWRLPVGP